jgi:hypothetical protein
MVRDKVADPVAGGVYQQGWYLPTSFLNSPWRGGGMDQPSPMGQQLPALPGGVQPTTMHGLHGIQPPAASPASQLEAEQQQLQQALAAGRIRPDRYERLMPQLQTRPDTLG